MSYILYQTFLTLYTSVNSTRYLHYLSIFFFYKKKLWRLNQYVHVCKNIYIILCLRIFCIIMIWIYKFTKFPKDLFFLIIFTQFYLKNLIFNVIHICLIHLFKHIKEKNFSFNIMKRIRSSVLFFFTIIENIKLSAF